MAAILSRPQYVNLLVSDHQMSCRDLTTRQDTSIAAATMPTYGIIVGYFKLHHVKPSQKGSLSNDSHVRNVDSDQCNTKENNALFKSSIPFEMEYILLILIVTVAL